MIRSHVDFGSQLTPKYLDFLDGIFFNRSLKKIVDTYRNLWKFLNLESSEFFNSY